MLWFTCSVVSDSSGPHGLQHTRPPCPSLVPRFRSNSCALSCFRDDGIHDAIQPSHPLSAPSPPAFSVSGSFPMGWLFATAGPRYQRASLRNDVSTMWLHSKVSESVSVNGIHIWMKEGMLLPHSVPGSHIQYHVAFLTALGLRCCVGFSLVATSRGHSALQDVDFSCGAFPHWGKQGFCSCHTWIH